MIRGVAFTGPEPAGAVARLRRGGLCACACSDTDHAAAAVQEWGLNAAEVLVIGPSTVPGTLSWQDLPHQAKQSREVSPSSDQVLQAIVQHNRQCILATADPSQTAAAANHQPAPPVLVVGYLMKASREEQLASSGLLHLLPINGVCFMPFDAARLSEDQGHMDLLLHKGSDESVVGPDGQVTWSQRLLDVQAWLAARPHICVVDPFPNTAKVLDRLLLGKLLDQLQQLQLPGGVWARAPQYCMVDSFAAADLQQILANTCMAAPFIVKPVVACGVAHSHSMALVLAEAALQHLQGQMPLPAVVQEFVNHGGQQYKVYVLGHNVFITPRASIPDVQLNPSSELSSEQQLLLFDSLGSLPTQLPAHMAAVAPTGTMQQQQQQQQQQPPNQQAVEAVAAFLRSHLGLTLFGFDVVLASKQQQQQQQQGGSGCEGGVSVARQSQQGCSQELVVIDINYFPNYRGGQDTPALFRAALLHCWQEHQLQAARLAAE